MDGSKELTEEEIRRILHPTPEELHEEFLEIMHKRKERFDEIEKLKAEL